MPNWRSPPAYAELVNADRAAFAWEWLRRHQAYRDDAERALTLRPTQADESLAARWGLHQFVSPNLPAGQARPIWRGERHGLVLRAHAIASEPDADAIVLSGLDHLATMVVSGAAQHLLLSDGYRAIRLDVTGTRLGDDPVRLHYALSGLESLTMPLAVLGRLRRLVRNGRLDRRSGTSDNHSQRMILTLRAWDGVAWGASQRELAGELLGREASLARWRINSPGMRSHAQRLVHAARAMAEGGFWELLRR